MREVMSRTGPRTSAVSAPRGHPAVHAVAPVARHDVAVVCPGALALQLQTKVREDFRGLLRDCEIFANVRLKLY